MSGEDYRIDGDVRVGPEMPPASEHAGGYFYPEVFFRGHWYPICRHWFWNSRFGVDLVCKKLGFSLRGRGERRRSSKIDPRPAMPVGDCKDAGDDIKKGTWETQRKWGQLDEFDICKPGANGAHIVMKCEGADNLQLGSVNDPYNTWSFYERKDSCTKESYLQLQQSETFKLMELLEKMEEVD